jgi:hypothetical protein
LASDVFVVDDDAYLADGEAGLQVIDISDPGNPSRVGYVALNGAGLAVVDVAIPSDPRLIGTITTPDSPYDVETYGNMVYAACRFGGLVAYRAIQ